jgi:hypothetical protein
MQDLVVAAAVDELACTAAQATSTAAATPMRAFVKAVMDPPRRHPPCTGGAITTMSAVYLEVKTFCSQRLPSTTWHGPTDDGKWDSATILEQTDEKHRLQRGDDPLYAETIDSMERVRRLQLSTG